MVRWRKSSGASRALLLRCRCSVLSAPRREVVYPKTFFSDLLSWRERLKVHVIYIRENLPPKGCSSSRLIRLRAAFTMLPMRGLEHEKKKVGHRECVMNNFSYPTPRKLLLFGPPHIFLLCTPWVVRFWRDVQPVR